MKEKIEVRYLPAAIVGFSGIYHKYIIYTNSNGEKFYARGGPESRTETSPSPPPFGNLETESGVYEEGSRDWDPTENPENPDSTAKPHPRETIKEGDDLSREWDKIKQTMEDIQNGNIPYDPKSSNSNAAVDEALREAGLPLPVMDGPTDNWAPGSDFDLPGGDVPGDNDAGKFLDDLTKWAGDKLEQLEKEINDYWDRAKNWVWPRDPLVFDLDGDGIETQGLNGAKSILFDSNGDGVKTATGWVNSHDGLLVWDRDGNGQIDSGRELFGDSTMKADGTLARDGLDALADLDQNGDGLINALDASWQDLRIWQDVNQDGISQANELKTLDEWGFKEINLAATGGAQNQANGNQISASASYTKTDGSSGSYGNLNFASNDFYREFTDKIALTKTAEGLPSLGGSGAVRDLREAMSLGTAKSATLVGLVEQFAQAKSAGEQRALLNDILHAWGKTSAFQVSGEASAYGERSTNISIAGAAVGSAAYQDWLDKLNTLERFNASLFATAQIAFLSTQGILTGTAGDDSISFNGQNGSATIYAGNGDGDDSIYAYGDGMVTYAGDGNARIVNNQYWLPKAA